MRAIREGDVFFSTSPFHSDNLDAAQEKRLSYLVGTISERPVVVIRPPEWWDAFNTVTVVPAMRKGHPAIVYHLVDRYGFKAAAEYPFVPHLGAPIPVSRLGRYIGSLDQDELEEIMYAFNWINNKQLQNDPEHYQVPKVYAKLKEDLRPHGSWKVNRDARSNVIIHVAPNGKIRSDTHPELNGFPIDEATRNQVMTDLAEDAIVNEGSFIATDNPVPGVNENHDTTVIPVEKEFPASIYPEEVLQRVAGNFSLSDAYYTDRKPRDPKVLTDDELSRIRLGVSTYDYNLVEEYYRKMSVMDAYLLGTRLPLKVLSEISDMNMQSAAALKRLCNVMRDMSEKEYTNRLENFEKLKKELVENSSNKIPVNSEPILVNKNKSEVKPKPATSAKDRVRQYLNPKAILTMPDDVAREFMAMPKGIVKNMWKGGLFKNSYESARSYYKAKLSQPQ